MQSSSTCYTISRPQIIREQFDEEVVIVDLDTGSYYSLGGAGGEVWSAIENGASQSEIINRLTEQYHGEKADIESSTLRLLQELQQEELIVARPAGESDSSTPDSNIGDPAETVSTNGTRPAFEAPILQKFTDMQALLLLDPIHEVDSAGWPQPKPAEPQMNEQAATLNSPSPSG